MLEITRIDRVGVVVAALPPQVALFEELFGFRAGQPTIDADGSAVRVRLSMPGRSDVDWEVAAPTLKSSHLQGFIDGPAGPGIHNVVLRVADLDGAVEELRSLEIEPWRGDPGDGSEPGEECFIHPAHARGRASSSACAGRTTAASGPRRPRITRAHSASSRWTIFRTRTASATPSRTGTSASSGCG